MIRVLLTEDHTIVRKGLLSLLAEEPSITVVGEAQDGREALEKAEVLKPDVVVMDIAMSGMNGIEATRQIKNKYPEINVIILSMYHNEEYILQALRAGAMGYLLKKSAPRDLVTAIQTISEGESYLSPAISRVLIEDYIKKAEITGNRNGPDQVLTQREREVLQLLAEGLTNRVIAERLCVSVKTVETHRAHIFEKLKLNNITDVVKYAIRKGLISLES